MNTAVITPDMKEIAPTTKIAVERPNLSATIPQQRPTHTRHRATAGKLQLLTPSTAGEQRRSLPQAAG
jgi:hypothetical protein